MSYDKGDSKEDEDGEDVENSEKNIGSSADEEEIEGEFDNFVDIDEPIKNASDDGDYQPSEEDEESEDMSDDNDSDEDYEPSDIEEDDD
jgi:hypothetical protein